MTFNFTLSLLGNEICSIVTWKYWVHFMNIQTINLFSIREECWTIFLKWKLQLSCLKILMFEFTIPYSFWIQLRNSTIAYNKIRALMLWQDRICGVCTLFKEIRRTEHFSNNDTIVNVSFCQHTQYYNEELRAKWSQNAKNKNRLLFLYCPKNY